MRVDETKMIVCNSDTLNWKFKLHFVFHTKNNCRYSKQMWHFHSAKIASDPCQMYDDDEFAHFTFKHTDTDLCSWTGNYTYVWHQNRFESNWWLAMF